MKLILNKTYIYHREVYSGIVEDCLDEKYVVKLIAIEKQKPWGPVYYEFKVVYIVHGVLKPETIILSPSDALHYISETETVNFDSLFYGPE